ncbi:histidine kinase [Actinopolymorpha sp. B11F2]|uniref:sensor histidine kinase n=1 Tax=Actinopolymorpha sp. B11F2 TaxID=3160862 RepID=UPI0032E443F2
MERPSVSLPTVENWVIRHTWAGDAVLATALLLVIGPTSLTLLWGAEWPLAARVGVSGLVLIGHLTIVIRRTWPVAAYLSCSLVMLALVLAPDFTGPGARELGVDSVPSILLPSALVYPVALYAVAAYSRRPWPTIALGIGLVGAVLTTVRLWFPGDWMAGQAGTDSAVWRLFVLLALVAAVLAPWGLGRFRGIRAAYVVALEERARRAEQDRAERAEQAAAAERSRIAREMHDVVAHSLAVMVRQAEGGRFAAAKDPARAVEALAMVAGTGREALADMRTVLGVLRRDEVAETTPQPTLDDVPALVERVRATGLPVELTTTGTPLALDRAASLAAFRVVQEALTNVVKHAGRDASASVRLTWIDGGLDIAVTDDGGTREGGAASPGGAVRDSGAVRDGGAAPGGHDGQGLVGMRERVTLAGGRMSVVPPAEPRGSGGRGFAVSAYLPARAREAST